MELEIAVDEDGRPFAVPPTAVGWRIFRQPAHGGGRPGLLRITDDTHKDFGQPLRLPLDVTLDDVRRYGAGRYKLDAVDQDGNVLPNVPQADTGPLELRSRNASAAVAPDVIAPRPDGAAITANVLLLEAVRANTRLAEQAVGQVATIARALAVLVEADGASYTTRRPPPLMALAAPVASEPAPEPEPVVIETAAPWWLPLVTTLAAQVTPLVMARLAPAVPANAPARAEAPEPPPDARASTADEEPTPSEAPAPIIDAATHARIAAVFAELTAEERVRVTQLVALLAPEARAAWLAELRDLTIPQAVQRIRAVLAPRTTSEAA